MNLSLYSSWGNISQNYISDFPFGGKKDNTVRVRNKSETMKRWLSFLTILFLFPGFNAFILIQISVLNSFKWLLTSEIVQLYSIFPQSSRWNWTGSFPQEKKNKKTKPNQNQSFLQTFVFKCCMTEISLDWLITNHSSCEGRRSKHYILLNGEAFVTFRKVSPVSSVITAETQCIWFKQGIRFLPGWTHLQPVSQGRGLTFLKMTDDVEYLSWHFKETWCLEVVGHLSLEKISYFRFPRGGKNKQVTGFWNTCCFSCAWGLICSLINKLCTVTSVEKTLPNKYMPFTRHSFAYNLCFWTTRCHCVRHDGKTERGKSHKW